MKCKVSVTEDDIANGTRGDRFGCPVYLAMATAGVPLRCVVEDWWLSSDEGRHLLPPEVGQWIRAFDRGNTVAPIEFEVDYEGTPKTRGCG